MTINRRELARVFSLARQAGKRATQDAAAKLSVLVALNTSRAPWANRVMAPTDIDLLEITYPGYQRQQAVLVRRSLDEVPELDSDVSFSAYQGTYPAVVTHVTLTHISTPFTEVVELEKPVMLRPGECFRLVRSWLAPIRSCDWWPA